MIAGADCEYVMRDISKQSTHIGTSCWFQIFLRSKDKSISEAMSKSSLSVVYPLK